MPHIMHTSAADELPDCRSPAKHGADQAVGVRGEEVRGGGNAHALLVDVRTSIGCYIENYMLVRRLWLKFTFILSTNGTSFEGIVSHERIISKV
jgi:hypothetical protein